MKNSILPDKKKLSSRYEFSKKQIGSKSTNPGLFGGDPIFHVLRQRNYSVWSCQWQG